jgi:alanyl-tRNA synthetase
LAKAEDHNGVQLIRLEGAADHNVLRQLPAILKTKFPAGKCALVGATEQDGKPMITVVLSQALVDAGKHAGQIIKSAAKHIQGGGGGQAWMATAGGRNAEGLVAALAEMVEAIEG